MKFIRISCIALAAALLALSVLASAATTKVQSQTKDGQAALLLAEKQFEQARTENGLEGWLSFFADDTVDLSPGLPIGQGKDEMRKRISAHWNPNNKLTWQAAKADVAASRDIGYTVGTWQLIGTGKDGKSFKLTGKYLTVWKKQKDGSWKVIADTGNEDPEPPAE